MLLFTGGSIHAEFPNTTGPKLLQSISDQTLYLDDVDRWSTERDLKLGYYVHDLRTSFETQTGSEFSAYVYNDSVVDAWVVDHYLVVRAKSVGSSQIAITTSHSEGSTIDWFIVQVDEDLTKMTPNSANLSHFYANSNGELRAEIKGFSRNAESFIVVPELPQNLSFDASELTIHGKHEKEIEEVFAVIAIDSDGNSEIHHVRFATSRNSREVSFSDELNLLDQLVSLNTGVNAQERPSVTSTSRFSYGSNPYRVQYSLANPTTNPDWRSEYFLLPEIASSMHMRSRIDENGSQLDTENPNSLQVWGYSSSMNYSQSQIVSSGTLIGVEYQPMPTWNAGIGISRFNNHEDSGGQSDRTTSVLPYVRWTSTSGNQIWGLIGFGSSSSNQVSDQANSVYGALGWRQRIRQSSSLELVSIGDIGLMLPMTDFRRNDPNLSMLESTNKSIRAGLEIAYSGDDLFEPFVGLSGRLNSVVENSNVGFETHGGVRLNEIKGLTFEAAGRTLALPYADQDGLAWGVSLAAHLDPGLQGEGLSVSLTPSYGLQGQTAIPDLQWISNTSYNTVQPITNLNQEFAMSGALSYGIPFLKGSTVTPFGQLSISTLNRSRLGFRVESNSDALRGFDLEVASIRYVKDEDQLLNQGIDIQLRLLF